MKIGILTLPLHFNYGGILQAYALQTVLERMGHEVCLIEKKKKAMPSPLWKAPLVYAKRILKNLTGTPFPIFYEQKQKREDAVIRQHTDLFIHKYIKQRFIDDYSDIKEGDFDAIIVGSDQIWRPKYFNRQMRHAYLDFTEGWNIKRIAYAASFGSDEWEYTAKQTKQYGMLLKKFDAVSVREDSGVDLCFEHFGVKAHHVLDPTMLLLKDDYIQLFEVDKTPESKGSLLCYILDETPEKLDIINKITKEKALIPFRVNSKAENIKVPLEERIQPSIEQWLRGFYDASFVVTDSFHACVFSIMFNKPFVVVGNAQRGMTRFNSLLRTMQLQNCLIAENTKFTIENIEYKKVNRLLKHWQNISLQYLLTYLK